MSFKLEEIREIVGEAYNDDMGRKLAKLHRTVVDPLMDQLDEAKSEAQRYKAKADKATELQKQVDDLSKGEDWKKKYEDEKKSHDDYRAQVEREKTTSRAKAAHKKLLSEEGISDKAIDSILNATDYGKVKLKDDGSLDDESTANLKKDITERWGGFKVSTRKRGEQVDNPIHGGGKMTKEEIFKIKDASERQAAIRENLDLFQKG